MIPAAPKPSPAWRNLLLRAETFVWRCLSLAKAPARPLAGAPHLMGIAPGHPESLSRLLPRRHERALAELDAELWPSGPFADVTRRFTELPKESRP